MFIISMKSEKLIKIIIASLVVFVMAIGTIMSVSKSTVMPVLNENNINMRAVDASERVAFFAQFGWEINEDPVEVKEIIIPEEFDETYTEYNLIQKQQNLDLEKYKGARVKMWSYEITNYPGYTASDGLIRGTLLIYDDIVIGGDVSCVSLDGFMHGFNYPQQ